MTKTEIHYHADRGDCADDYQSLDLVQELGNNRQYIKFTLMENRWRSPKEAAEYLRWAAEEIDKLR